MVAVDRNRVLRTAGAASLLAVGVLFAPQRASAACGDYVIIVGENGQPAAQQPGHDAGTPRQPCHGPDCSASPCRPDLPLSAPVTTPPNPNEGVAAIPGALADPGDPDGYPVPTSSGRVIHRPASVFHPPPTA
jgi:hypothetical protein